MLDEIRVEPITVGQYLLMVENECIKTDQAVQRDFCWGNEIMSSLVYSSVSRKIFIPTIILAEQKKENGVKKTYVVDGGHRTETLRRFRFEGYKTSKNMRSYLIPYKNKKLDEHGQAERDEYGDIIWEFDMFDLRNKTYDDLPEDLKDKFNGCPLSQAIYQDCTPEETSELVQLYNNHVSMNVSQKALTYIGKFANEIKRIKDNNRFLKDGTALTELDKKKGIWERVISECVMAVNHFEEWKKQPQKMCEYLNNNSSIEEYKNIEGYFNRLIPYVDKLENKAVSDLFVAKNVCVWMMVFDKFSKLGIHDSKFGEFLNAFVTELNMKTVNDINWVTLDSDKHTKDKSVLAAKASYIESLMMGFLGIDIGKNQSEDSDITYDESISVLDFVKENVDDSVSDMDINDYEKALNDYEVEIEESSRILEKQNKMSLIALVAYAWILELDNRLPEWFATYFTKNNTYDVNQQKNYIIMRDSFERFVQEGAA